MYAIDLFCGAGGFSEGILQSGFHIVFSSDRSPYVQQTYMNRHEQLGLIQGVNTHFELSDIRNLHGEFILERINGLSHFKDLKMEFKPNDIDAIFGGPPCQGFSVAGKRDINDPRNMLFREYLRVVQYIRPKYIVMENVTGFMNMPINPNFESFHGHFYGENELVSSVLTVELSDFGYTVLPPRILDSSDYGVPQKRQRAIFLAYRNDVAPINYPTPTTPEAHQKLTVEDALAGISMGEVNSHYAEQSRQGRTPLFGTNTAVPNLIAPFNMEESKHSAVIVERFSLFKQGESVNNLKLRLRALKENGEVVIDSFDVSYPNLLQETVFNINKTHNFELLTEQLGTMGINVGTKDLESIYKKIIKFWNYDVNSPKFDKDVKKSLNDWISLDQFKQIMLNKENLNNQVSINDLVQWFSNTVPLDVTDLVGEQFVLGNRTDMTWEELFNALLTNKNTRTRLDANKPGPTMVTLPDDFIHPTLNKILNVREMARIQSFDDSFEFLGKRTTGGTKRSEEVPQFTQVGNAVPPLLAAAVAREVALALNTVRV
ncbi:DNA cytosine methyltransferase [Lysinibacillus capsici]|uniref:DNA cytosine methyltransferase n=1 Tax=Lysinibacillus capsici TaxID=2115968 RepID=UPI0028BDA067|nr:DNA cytosine methyltransferase [Lysinibacillus capsici]WNN76251.1 DNA cytosine methyltransferase [Lysinibacillus capsici]